MLMALFQNKESLSSNKTTRVCGQADKNVQLQARPRGLIGVRREINLLLHPIVIRRLTHRYIAPTFTDINCVATDRLIGIALPTRCQLPPFLFSYLFIYP